MTTDGIHVKVSVDSSEFDSLLAKVKEVDELALDIRRKFRPLAAWIFAIGFGFGLIVGLLVHG